MLRLLFFLLLATALPTFAARQRPETPEAIARQILAAWTWAAVVQMDFWCFPCRRLVEPVWVRLIGLPGSIEPFEIGFFVGDPFLDRLPVC